MSIEDTKRELLEGHDADGGLHLDCGDYVNASCEECATKLDRLVLEVLAELPCQRAAWGELADECTSQNVVLREVSAIELCVSCAARARKAALEPVFLT